MTSALIKPGTFVLYTHLGDSGIGKVEDGGENPLVTFWDNGKFGKLERKKASDLAPLADAGPVALMWDRPEELGLWVKEKPLKLVALALSIDGGRGKPSSIKEKLDCRVPLGMDWKTWWSKRAKSLSNLPDHFEKSVKGNEYTLLCSIEDVPDEAQPPVTLADWKKWLLSDTNLPTIGKNPIKAVSEALAEWPADTIERALSRVLWGAERLLDSPKKPSAAAALLWMDAVGSVALQWCALYPDSQQLAERSGDVLSRLSQHIKVKKKRRESALFQAGILSEGPDRQFQLDQQRQEQERLCADYKNRLEQQRQEREQLSEALKGERQERERLSEALKSEQQEREQLSEALKSERQKVSMLDQEVSLRKQQVRERNAELDRMLEKLELHKA